MHAGSANHHEDGNRGSGEKSLFSCAHQIMNISASFPLVWLSSGRLGRCWTICQAEFKCRAALVLLQGLHCSASSPVLEVPHRGRTLRLPSHGADPPAGISAMSKWADHGQGVGGGCRGWPWGKSPLLHGLDGKCAAQQDSTSRELMKASSPQHSRCSSPAESTVKLCPCMDLCPFQYAASCTRVKRTLHPDIFSWESSSACAFS